MVQHVAELNRVLITAEALLVGAAGIDKSMLVEHCKAIAIEGRMPDHRTTIDFSIEIGMIKVLSKRVGSPGTELEFAL